MIYLIRFTLPFATFRNVGIDNSLRLGVIGK